MPEFKGKGYLYTTRLGSHGEKKVVFEFSASEALELAKLELMGRDLSDASHPPVLLDVTVKVAKEKSLGKGYKNAGSKKPAQIIR